MSTSTTSFSPPEVLAGHLGHLNPAQAAALETLKTNLTKAGLWSPGGTHADEPTLLYAAHRFRPRAARLTFARAAASSAHAASIPCGRRSSSRTRPPGVRSSAWTSSSRAAPSTSLRTRSGSTRAGPAAGASISGELPIRVSAAERRAGTRHVLRRAFEAGAERPASSKACPSMSIGLPRSRERGRKSSTRSRPSGGTNACASAHCCVHLRARSHPRQLRALRADDALGVPALHRDTHARAGRADAGELRNDDHRPQRHQPPRARPTTRTPSTGVHARDSQLPRDAERNHHRPQSELLLHHMGLGARSVCANIPSDCSRASHR
jgi:hypothetical protein